MEPSRHSFINGELKCKKSRKNEWRRYGIGLEEGRNSSVLKLRINWCCCHVMPCCCLRHESHTIRKKPLDHFKSTYTLVERCHSFQISVSRSKAMGHFFRQCTQSTVITDFAGISSLMIQKHMLTASNEWSVWSLNSRSNNLVEGRPVEMSISNGSTYTNHRGNSRYAAAGFTTSSWSSSFHHTYPRYCQKSWRSEDSCIPRIFLHIWQWRKMVIWVHPGMFRRCGMALKA